MPAGRAAACRRSRSPCRGQRPPPSGRIARRAIGYLRVMSQPAPQGQNERRLSVSARRLARQGQPCAAFGRCAASSTADKRARAPVPHASIPKRSRAPARAGALLVLREQVSDSPCCRAPACCRAGRGVMSPYAVTVYTRRRLNDTPVRVMTFVVEPATRVLRSYMPGGSATKAPALLYATVDPIAVSTPVVCVLRVQRHRLRVGDRVHEAHVRRSCSRSPAADPRRRTRPPSSSSRCRSRSGRTSRTFHPRASPSVFEMASAVVRRRGDPPDSVYVPGAIDVVAGRAVGSGAVRPYRSSIPRRSCRHVVSVVVPVTALLQAS